MYGMPMQASKVFMKHALKNLKSKDSFRIIRFSDNVSEFTDAPVTASKDNIAAGLRYVNGLQASGGTEILKSIDQAFLVPAKQDTLRIVVFLTDGYIGNEASVLQRIGSLIGNARIYSLGVGTSVNRYLLNEMAILGKGKMRVIDPTSNTEDMAIQFAKRIESPILKDISIDWGDTGVSQITPAILPDLFAGESIRVQGKYSKSGKHKIYINGNLNGHKARLPLVIDLPREQSHKESEAIALLWARTKIAEYMRYINAPANIKTSNFSNESLKQMVTKLGLDYSLVTRWTSFVAVSNKVVNPNTKDTPTKSVPLQPVKGMSLSKGFSGSSVPEPELMGGLLIMGVVGMLSFFRRRKGK